MLINDGYTEQWGIYVYRPLPRKECKLILDLIENQHWTVADQTLWISARVLPSPVSEKDKQEVFDQMILAGKDLEDHQENLRRSVELLLSNPLLAKRTCELCKTWWFDHDSGYIVQGDSGPLKRIPLAKLPCESTSCEKGHYSDPLIMSDRNKQAWNHYLEFRHVGLPDSHRRCPIVRGNWRIIGELIEKHGNAAIHS